MDPDLAVLNNVQQRVLWLATRMVHEANYIRPNPDSTKVGGHQASCASVVTIMTALYFGGWLRAFGGLQAYPSRTKDPDPVDFSTASVGLGAAAPLFGALADRYAATHFRPDQGQPRRRFVAIVGDAELDEGNVWEAIGDETIRGHIVNAALLALAQRT